MEAQPMECLALDRRVRKVSGTSTLMARAEDRPRKAPDVRTLHLDSESGQSVASRGAQGTSSSRVNLPGRVDGLPR